MDSLRIVNSAFTSPYSSTYSLSLSQSGDNQLACHRCLWTLNYGNLEIDIRWCCHLVHRSQMLLPRLWRLLCVQACEHFQEIVSAFHLLKLFIILFFLLFMQQDSSLCTKLMLLKDTYIYIYYWSNELPYLSYLLNVNERIWNPTRWQKTHFVVWVCCSVFSGFGL